MWLRAKGHFSPDIAFCLHHVQLLQLWEKNGYFDDSIIQQLQSPALGLGQYQVSAVTSYTWVPHFLCLGWELPVGSDFKVQVAFFKQSSQAFLWDPGEHRGPGSEQRPQWPHPMQSEG